VDEPGVATGLPPLFRLGRATDAQLPRWGSVLVLAPLVFVVIATAVVGLSAPETPGFWWRAGMDLIWLTTSFGLLGACILFGQWRRRAAIFAANWLSTDHSLEFTQQLTELAGCKIPVSQSLGSGVRSSLADHCRRWSQLRSRYISVAIPVALALAFALIWSTKPHSETSSWSSMLWRITMIVKWVVAPVLWASVIGIGIWSLLGFSVFAARNADLVIERAQPWSSDRCGGMRPFTSFLLASAAPLLIGIVVLAITMLLASFKIIAINENYFVSNFAAAGFLLAGIYTLAFMGWPVWAVHTALVDVRRSYTTAHTRRMVEIGRQLQSCALAEECEKIACRKNAFDALERLHADRIDLPTWPFDRTLVAKVGIPYAVGIAGWLSSFLT